MDHATQDPQNYPKLKIEGQEVEVKLRAFDVVELHKAGINISEARATLGENLERAFTILHHGIAHHFEDTPDKWPSTEKLLKMDLGASCDVLNAVNESIKKAMAQWKATYPELFKDPKKPETSPTIQ